MKKRRKLAALALVVVLGFLVGARCYFGRQDDPFTAKYRMIQSGTTYEEVVELLGPPDHEFHTGSPFSIGGLAEITNFHYYNWINRDDGRRLVVKCDAMHQVRLKSLLARDYNVISSQWFDTGGYSKPWWKRLLSMIGL